MRNAIVPRRSSSDPYGTLERDVLRGETIVTAIPRSCYGQYVDPVAGTAS